jgi:hypothetical protein
VGDSTFDVTRTIVLTDTATGFWFYSDDDADIGVGTGRRMVIGDNDGHLFLGGSLSDLTGTPVAHTSYWTSKALDLSDQIEGVEDKWKTIDHIRLLYEDISTSTPTTIHLSNDGGITWTSKSYDLGTGDGTPKWADFWFRVESNCTGKDFIVKVESPAVVKDFIWTGIQLVVDVRGESFDV